jgi:hypothetical protein
MNAKVKILELKKPLLAANAWVKDSLHSIYFSADRTLGFIIAINPLAQIGEIIELSEGPKKGLGRGEIIEIN